jgi:hypothetical protein
VASDRKDIQMNKLTVLLMPIVLLVFGAVVASPAMAGEAPQWLVEGTAIKAGTTVDAEVKTETGKLFLLEDMGELAKVDILCEIAKAEGVLMYNGAAEITEVECAKPTVDSGTCSSPKVSPVDLPWQSEMTESESGVFEAHISSSAGSSAGWKVECTVLGVKVTDTCTTNDAKALLTNAAEGSVDAEFKEEVGKEEEAECSVGGKEAGLESGSFVFVALGPSKETEKLSVSAATVAFEGPSWWVKGARFGAGGKKTVGTKASGTWTLRTSGVTISCSKLAYTGEILGSAAATAGTNNGSITFEGCTVSSETGCEIYSFVNKGSEESPQGKIGPIPILGELLFLRNGRNGAYDLFHSQETSLSGSQEFTFLLFKTKPGGTCNLATAETMEVNGRLFSSSSIVGQLQSSVGVGIGPNAESVEVTFEFPTTGRYYEYWGSGHYNTTSPIVLYLISPELSFNEPITISGTVTTELSTKEPFGWTNT